MVAGGRELIDTLWNVNPYTARKEFLTQRINRYIMECKFSRGREVWKSETGINRYIMECKWETVSFLMTWVSRINRYIMECKSYR